MGAYKVKRRLFGGLAVAAAVFLSFATAAGNAEAKARPLFGEAQAQVAAGRGNRRTEVRSRRVKVDMSAVAGVDLPDGADAIELNLFTDKKFEAVKSRFNRRDKNHFTWFGKVPDDPRSSVVLVAGDGQMQGLIFAHGRHFSIQGADADSQEVVEIDQSAFPKENCDELPSGDGAQSAPALPLSPDAPADTGSAIDVLVVYTPAARKAAGGASSMLNLAQLAIDTTNVSYANSLIAPRLTLAHAEEVAYTESAYFSTDWDRLKKTSDGFMDTVHALRDAYWADVVVLLIKNPASCGIAYIEATETTAFAVVAWDCAVGNYSFGHEIGHLQGARHDWYVDWTPGFNHGDVDLASRQRTVMAYNNECRASGFDCERLPYWSNPDVTYSGTSSTPMGSLERENNVRVLNESAYTVANFRLQTVQLTVQSTYPAGGVSIAPIIPADNNGTSSRETPFTLDYDANTSVTLTAQDPNGDGLSFVNWSGCATASGTSCTVTMDGNKTVTANYDTANYLPTLDAISNRTLKEGAGMQTVWLSGISAGPGEGGQTFVVTAASSDPALIPDPVVNHTGADATGSLIFTPVADANGTATITVTVTDDGDATNGYNIFARSFGVTVIAVNDAPSFVKGPDQTVLEDTGAQEVAGWATDIRAGPADESAQTLLFLTTNDRHGLFSVQPAVGADGTLTFTPAVGASGSAKVTVRLRDNGGTANGGVNTSGARTFTITVNDPPTLNAIGDVAISEDAGRQIVALSGISAGGRSQSLTVTAVSSNTGLIPNPGVGYRSPRATGSLSFRPRANASGVATITVTVNDRQKGNNTVAREFVVTVNAVNDVPTLNAISSRTIKEDATMQTVSLGGITAGGGESQTLAVTAVSSNTALIPDPTVIYTSPGATGSLSFIPVENANGKARITVTVDDGEPANNLRSRYFDVTVKAVNDAPGFVKGPDQAVLVNDGAQTVAGWATGISAGPANESTQTLSFITTNDRTGLFGAQPKVAADGTLSFRPATNKSGSATVTVRLRDSGGTDYGGVNTSAAQTFTITVTPPGPSDAPLADEAAMTPGPDSAEVIQTAATAAEFQAALDVAAANGRHDIIRLAGGVYALSGNAGRHFAYSSTEDKGLVIEGGWTPDFNQWASNIPTELRSDVPDALAGSGGVLEVTAGGSVSLNGIAITGGQAAGSGGGAHITAAGAIVVGNCRILNNVSGSDGGGLFLESTGGEVRLYGSTIQGNSGASSGGGLVRALSATVYGNEISGNEAAATDGGLQASVISGGSLIVSNNTIYGNQAPAGGSGLSVGATGARGLSVLDIRNNIVYGNGVAPDFVVAPDGDCLLNFLDLNVVNNDIACYEMCPEYLLDGTNTGVDFSGRAAGTFRLSAGDTALIDRGSADTMPLEDIEGDAIPLAGAGGASAVPDIGADEYNPENTVGPTALSVSASGSIAAANGSATITVMLDAPAKRDLVLFLNSGDPTVVTLNTPYLMIFKGSNSAQTVVRAASGATSGAATITVTDPSGRIAAGSVEVSVDIVE
ncbi:MAG: zinc-dependent metalloprotease family protein [Candidatus Geothermincolia bacterium]